MGLKARDLIELDNIQGAWIAIASALLLACFVSAYTAAVSAAVSSLRENREHMCREAMYDIAAYVYRGEDWM